MNMENAKWIGTDENINCPVFVREFRTQDKALVRAGLVITAIGVYEACLNEKRAGNFVLAPGLTSYATRLQYQNYDVTELVKSGDNKLEVTLGTGWYRGRISEKWEEVHNTPNAVKVALTMEYDDGTAQTVYTDESFSVRRSNIISSDIYDGEEYDARVQDDTLYPVIIRKDITGQKLIPQENEYITEQERLKAKRVFTAPNGEKIVDFGENAVGYASFSINAHSGDRIVYNHAEELDADGNAYRDNYRSARTCITYICKEGMQSFKPHFCFMGFRYLCFKELPEYVTDEMILGGFELVTLYTDMKRTGVIESGNTLINQLYLNTLRSQRSNFIDIPTDCPQRDERMGWTGDAQVFCRTASYNYDVHKFFTKWCRDLRAEQRPDGSIPDTVPNFWRLNSSSTAWGDAICIIPWQMYVTYGDKDILKENFDAMKKWVEYMRNDSTTEYLWTCKAEDKALWRKHYGDWLALDAPEGSYKGSTDDDFIASAFFYYSTTLVIKAGRVIGEDVSGYERLADNIRKKFVSTYTKYSTQTEHILALYFGLTDNPEETARALCEDIEKNGKRMKTGFVGTPYILHTLSSYGYGKLAYDLLLQEEFPSWLFSVKQGATSIWEHWDGKKADGTFWSADMNSFNHYAYGSVFDWVYSYVAGITQSEDYAGYGRVRIAPHPDERLGYLNTYVDTAAGRIVSNWRYEDCKNEGSKDEDGNDKNGKEGNRKNENGKGGNRKVVYEITSPVPGECYIDGENYVLCAGETLRVVK